MGRYSAHGFGPTGKCWPVGPCHRHHVSAITVSGLCARLRDGVLIGGASVVVTAWDSPG
jgi:hypothetical protein